MRKKLILSLGVLFLLSIIFSLSFVSAGLCKGSDGYYHDCNDFSDSYYRHNFYPNYKTEYYKETSSSASSIISIKEDRYNYEEINADSYAESDIEIIKIERDYSYPKTRYDKYGRYYYDSGYDNYYEWDDEPHAVVFLNDVRPYYEEDNKDCEDCDCGDCSYWRYKEPYNSEDYYDAEYDDYYYKPRYNFCKQVFNWRW
jgi:hypothetical protein